MTRLLVCLLPLLPCLNAAERSPVVPSRDPVIRAERKADGTWFLDFGRAAFGNVEIKVPAGSPAARVTLHLGEALDGDLTVNRSPGGTVRYQRHEVDLRAGATSSPKLSWNPPGWMKDGWLELPKGMPQVMPFRYLEVAGAPDDFKPGWVIRVSYAVPFNESASAFKSSDPHLDGIYDLCKHSIKATSFLGLHIDGDRERKPYEADVLINQLSHYCVDADYRTARLSHEYLLEKPTWPTEWRLQSVILAWHDFLWSGEDASLRRHYQTLKGRTMADRRTDDGLFLGWNKGPVTDIVDWPAGERDGYDMAQPVKTAVTAFHYRAVHLMAEIARRLGRDEDARVFLSMAQATRKAVNERLWDEMRGCYVDGLDPGNGKRSGHASAHANFFPLALGLVPEDRVARVAAYLKPRGMACSVYGAQFLLEALYAAGEADHALALMVSDGPRSWRNMTEKLGSTITLEAWGPEFKPNLDWNHAWGAAPGNIIPRCLMGIEPLEPGFAKFRVKPQTSALANASVKLPTPKGPVIFSFTGSAPSEWQARLVVPAGTAAEFHLPFSGTPVTLKSGASTPVRSLREENGRRVIGLTAGDWTVRVDE